MFAITEFQVLMTGAGICALVSLLIMYALLRVMWDRWNEKFPQRFDEAMDRALLRNNRREQFLAKEKERYSTEERPGSLTERPGPSIPYHGWGGVE